MGGRSSTGGKASNPTRRGAFNYNTNKFNDVDSSFSAAVQEGERTRSLFGTTADDYVNSYRQFFSDIKSYARSLKTISETRDLYNEFSTKINQMNLTQLEKDKMLSQLRKSIRG